MTDPDVLERAQRALDLVGTDPREALRQADDVLTMARPRDSPEAVSTAQRAAALALKEMGDLASAEQRLRSGLRSTAGRSARGEAQARMSLAFILLERGHTRAALGQADRAAAGLSGVDGARLLGQRALVLQRAGHTNQALAAYAKAMPALRRAGDVAWEARLLNNRGLLHAYHGSTAKARSDLMRARELMSQRSQRLDVADAEWNLGFVAAVEGDIPEALRCYDRAEAFYIAESLPVGRLRVDRSLILLRAGLLDEARAGLEAAAEELAGAGAAADEAEARVALAQVQVARGALLEASEAAVAAEALLKGQQRPGWLMLARWIAYLATEPRGSEARWAAQGHRLAAQLRAAGWHEEEREILLMQSRRLVARRELAKAEALLQQARQVRTRGTSSGRHRLAFGNAVLSEARGDRAAALRAARSGFKELDRQRGLLGATELRVGLAAQGADLATVALRVALADGRPATVLEFAERSRAAAFRTTSVRPPRSRELAEALTDVRRAGAELAAARMATEPDRGYARDLTHAEQRVVRLTRTQPGSPSLAAAVVPRLGEVKDALGSRALAEYVEVDGRFSLLTIVDGWSRLHDLGAVAPITMEADTLRFTLQRLSTRPSDRLAASHSAAAERMAQLILWPASELADRELVISPVGSLQSLPWHSLPGLHDRVLTVAPSASLWCRAASGSAGSGGSVALAGGPDLDAVGTELAAVRVSWPQATVLEGGDATVDRTLAAMNGAAVAHLAAHGRLRADNPLFSALQMADGPLTVYDIEGLRSAPRVVVLPACRSAVSTVRSGEELLGLSAAFLAMGSRAVIASVVPVPDEQTAVFMARFHHELSAGLSPAAALAAARGRSANLTERLLGSSFLCLGGG